MESLKFFFNNQKMLEHATTFGLFIFFGPVLIIFYIIYQKKKILDKALEIEYSKLSSDMDYCKKLADLSNKYEYYDKALSLYCYLMIFFLFLLEYISLYAALIYLIIVIYNISSNMNKEIRNVLNERKDRF